MRKIRCVGFQIYLIIGLRCKVALTPAWGFKGKQINWIQSLSARPSTGFSPLFPFCIQHQYPYQREDNMLIILILEHKSNGDNGAGGEGRVQNEVIPFWAADWKGGKLNFVGLKFHVSLEIESLTRLDVCSGSQVRASGGLEMGELRIFPQDVDWNLSFGSTFTHLTFTENHQRKRLCGGVFFQSNAASASRIFLEASHYNRIKSRKCLFSWESFRVFDLIWSFPSDFFATSAHIRVMTTRR